MVESEARIRVKGGRGEAEEESGLRSRICSFDARSTFVSLFLLAGAWTYPMLVLAPLALVILSQYLLSS